MKNLYHNLTEPEAAYAAEHNEMVIVVPIEQPPKGWEANGLEHDGYAYFS